jgi:hypothetical protein
VLVHVHNVIRRRLRPTVLVHRLVVVRLRLIEATVVLRRGCRFLFAVACLVLILVIIDEVEFLFVQVLVIIPRHGVPSFLTVKKFTSRVSVTR